MNRRAWSNRHLLSAAWAAAALVSVIFNLVGSEGRGIERTPHETYYVMATRHYAWSFSAWFMLFAAAYGVLGRLWKPASRSILGWIHFALASVGVLLITGPMMWMKLAPSISHDPEAAFQAMTISQSSGYVFTVAGLVPFLWILASSLRARLAARAEPT